MRFAIALLAATLSAQTPNPPRPLIDYQSFLSRHDLVWNRVPQTWEEGALLGNGLIGAMVYANGTEGLRFDLGRSDVTDHRNDPDPMIARPRLPIGKLLLLTSKPVTKGDARLDLWNAEARGTLNETKWRAYVHAIEPLLVIETQGDARFSYRPDTVINTRKIRRAMQIKADDLNPGPWFEQQGDLTIVHQERTSGGGVTVAYRQINNRLLLTIHDSYPTYDPAPAIATLRRAVASAVNLDQTHRVFWHAYYPLSFVSIPDARLESFYWIQMYKLASGTRADRPAIDNQGPWFRPTPWPGIWWNLNIQLSYWPVYTANRLTLGESLLNIIDRNRDTLIQNVPPDWRNDSAAIGRTSSYDARSPVDNTDLWPARSNPKAIEFGNLTWALHNYWLHYRYTMDDAMLRDRLYPLLRRSINYYLHLLTEESGVLHIPEAISPEYDNSAQDTNYDLSLLRWGLTTLIDSSARLKIDDPLLPKWRDTLARLAPYPTNENGFMIGRNVPFAKSHRHFSHLLMIYPLRLVHDDTALIDKSLKHWIGFEGALQGYSFVGASAISSMLGRGDDALTYLNGLIDRFVKPNTMYMESGPVIETPLAAAQAIHEMLLQSWGGTIRIFPAIPSKWQNATFHQLRAEGAFLVSAARRNGRTTGISIQSLAGEPCIVETDLNLEGFHVKRLAANRYSINLKKGESFTRTLILQPVTVEGDTNWFGQSRH
jgi:hypothetical protein